MSYTITYTCERCGKEHDSGSHTITGHDRNNCDLEIRDLCHGCYKKISRALKHQQDLVTGIGITFGVWLGSVFTAMALGAFICYAIVCGG